MSEIEKQITKEIVADAKGLNKDAKIYVKGIIDGLKATAKGDNDNA